MSNSDFVHLHSHSPHSLLDGASDSKKAVEHVKSQGQTALAITDHGNMMGVVQFYEACVEAGIAPIIGMESYLTMIGRTRFDRDSKIDRKSYHLLLLAKNQTGYKNLIKMSSIAHLEGFYYSPRVDRDILQQYSDGLIVTSGCLGSEIPDLVMSGEYDLALEKANWYRDIWGDDFYLEMQYRGSQDQHTVNKWITEVSKDHGFKPIITTDAHYIAEGDAYYHDLLLCIQTKSNIHLPRDQRMMFDEQGSYSLLSTEKMKNFVGDYVDPIRNTVEIAEKCKIDLTRTHYEIPEFVTPDGYNSESFLRELCEVGLRWRFPDTYDSSEVRERLESELLTIHDMGFDDYFLVVWDVIMFCVQHDIYFNVRGSGAGSIVAYALGITSVDPLLNGLLFDRFLQRSRVSMPDIDLDIQDDLRDIVVEYVVSNYGRDKVAGIITFQTMGGKSAIHRVGKAMGFDRDITSQVAKYIKTSQGNTLPLDRYPSIFPELDELLKSSGELQAVYDGAIQLQGMPSSKSQHPAGFIITGTPMTDHVPVTKLSGGAFANTGLACMVQWDMNVSESQGLLKVDFLGLKCLTVMRHACKMIADRHGHNWHISDIPYRHTGDPTRDSMLDEAFEMIGRGDTAGVFQIDGVGLTGFMMDMKPSKFEHIIAGVSLYRPGPMGIGAHHTYNKSIHGEIKPSYLHPDLEQVLGETYGLIIYQEQLMQIAALVAGYGDDERDEIRRAVSKKKAKDLAYHYKKFTSQGVERGYSEDVCNQLWEQMEYFAQYGFNKSHGTDYAKLTVQTAFLKVHYPIEFMAATLQSYLNDSDKLGVYLGECKRRMGIPILPPSINHSVENFSIEKQDDGTEAIRVGFSAIKNVSTEPSQFIIKSRQGKPFKDYGDLIDRLEITGLNKKVHEYLIMSGAMDEMEDRGLQLASFENHRQAVKKSKSKIKKVEGQMSLFELAGIEPDIPDIDLHEYVDESKHKEYTWRELLDMEHEAMGFYVTARPTDEFEDEFHNAVTTSVATLKDEDVVDEIAGSIIRIGGQISGIRGHVDKNGGLMAFVNIDDWHETAETMSVTVFASMWKLKEVADVIQEGAIVLVEGTVSIYNGKLGMAAKKFIRLDKKGEVKQPERQIWKG